MSSDTMQAHKDALRAHLAHLLDLTIGEKWGAGYRGSEELQELFYRAVVDSKREGPVFADPGDEQEPLL